MQKLIIRIRILYGAPCWESQSIKNLCSTLGIAFIYSHWVSHLFIPRPGINLLIPKPDINLLIQIYLVFFLAFFSVF